MLRLSYVCIVMYVWFSNFIMKEHNQLVRFKNAFVSDPQQKETVSSILN